MGIVNSLNPRFAAAKEGEQQAAKIQIALWKEELRNLYHFKVLVLGAGESGKSTVVKQLRFIHKTSMLTDREKKRVTETLAENTMDCLAAMLEACRTYNIEVTDPEDLKTAEILMNEEEDKPELSPQLAKALRRLWESEPIQRVYQDRDKYWLLDSVEYFMDNVERFARADFSPSEEDVVMARVRTTGIVTTEFEQRNMDSKNSWDKTIHYQVIDVGGQRAERKKWMHCFDDVKAVLFVVNMAGYNMVLFEQDTKNRMHEALELFRDTVNKEIFKRTPIFLFLNKKDLFEEKLRNTDLSKCFEEYKGGQVTQNALDYISQKFREQMPPENLDQFRDFYIASRVKRDVKYAFEDLQADLLRMNQKRIAGEEKRILQEARFAKNNF